jgi:hypothetical protein
MAKTGERPRRIAARIATAVDFVQTRQIVSVDVAMLQAACLRPVGGEAQGGFWGLAII